MIPEESNGPVGEGKVVIPKTSVRLGAVAGANSSGFNVYRKQRRAENARLASLQEEKQQRDANEALRRKIEANRREAEDRTSKKAAKRRKRKAQKRAARSVPSWRERGTWRSQTLELAQLIVQKMQRQQRWPRSLQTI